MNTTLEWVQEMKQLLLIGAALLVSAAGQTQQGTASYFDNGVNGHSKTASGRPVQPNANTAASRTLPLGSTAKVTNRENGKSTDVQITDRGPTQHDRVIDLSKKAAGEIGMQKQGVAPVTVKPESSH